MQLFEDPCVEKEVDIRKRVLRDFNKKEEDFSSLREYNDYLEEVENIIFNLTNNIDIVETNKKIEQYKKENRELILKNKIKIGREELELDELIEEEKQFDEIRKKEFIKEELELKKKKIREKEALIDELMFSNADAKNIVNTFAQNTLAAKEELKQVPAPTRATQFSTGIKFTRQNLQTQSIQKLEDGPLYTYSAPAVEWEGPEIANWTNVATKGFLAHMKAASIEEYAGGYSAQIGCMRALQEASIGLFSVR